MIHVHNIYEDKVDSEPEQALSSIPPDNKPSHELFLHKSLIDRSESIGNLGYWEYDFVTGKIWASQGARHIYGIGDCELSINEIQSISRVPNIAQYLI